MENESRSDYLLKFFATYQTYCKGALDKYDYLESTYFTSEESRLKNILTDLGRTLKEIEKSVLNEIHGEEIDYFEENIRKLKLFNVDVKNREIINTITRWCRLNTFLDQSSSYGKFFEELYYVLDHLIKDVSDEFPDTERLDFQILKYNEENRDRGILDSYYCGNIFTNLMGSTSNLEVHLDYFLGVYKTAKGREDLFKKLYYLSTKLTKCIGNSLINFHLAHYKDELVVNTSEEGTKVVVNSESLRESYRLRLQGKLLNYREANSIVGNIIDRMSDIVIDCFKKYYYIYPLLPGETFREDIFDTRRVDIIDTLNEVVNIKSVNEFLQSRELGIKIPSFSWIKHVTDNLDSYCFLIPKSILGNEKTLMRMELPMKLINLMVIYTTINEDIKSSMLELNGLSRGSLRDIKEDGDTLKRFKYFFPELYNE